MASIRRTLSPANHDRSPSHHLNGSSPGPLKPFLIINPRFQPQRSLKRPFFRCLFFFFIGFLLGIISPFGHIQQNIIQSHDFSFETKPQHEVDKFNVVLAHNNNNNNNNNVVDYHRKLLIVVTPTFNRILQSYYLNRLGQVLKLVDPPVLWIVVEMNAQSSETATVLRDTGVMYRHLVCKRNMTDIKDRGVHQRNTALDHIQLHRLDGIVYFADDDNVYSLRLFQRIRHISRFGTWPVAMMAQNKNKVILEGPVCSKNEVIGWHTNEKSKRLRRFHVDMSGFAFNSTILWDSKRWKRPFLNPIRQLDTVKEGFQETTFIEQLVAEESQMEGVPGGCAEVLNWHLHLDASGVTYPSGWLLQQDLDVVLPID